MMVTILDDGHHTGTEVHKLKQYTILVVGGYLHTSTPNILVGGTGYKVLAGASTLVQHTY